MKVTLEEFKRNVDYYLDKVCEENIIITNNEIAVAELNYPNEKIQILNKLKGIAKDTSFETLNNIKDERLKRQ